MTFLIIPSWCYIF